MSFENKQHLNFRRIISGLLLILFFIPGRAQILEPSFSFGYGSYAMSDLKRLQDNLIEQIPFPLKIVDNFPSYANYEMSLMVPLVSKYHKVGIAFGGMSTGSRANVSDYSGSYTLDQMVKGTRFGINYEGLLSEFSIFQLNFNTNVSYLQTEYQLKEKYLLGNQINQEETIELVSSSLCFEPRLKFSMLVRRLVLSVQAGYMLDSNKPLHLKDDKDLELQLDEESIGADFSGVRFNAILSFRIG